MSAFDVAADLDVATVLAWLINTHVLDDVDDHAANHNLDVAIIANPLLGKARRVEMAAVTGLLAINTTLHTLIARASEQLTELIVRYRTAGDEKIDDLTARMDDLDRRRLTLLQYAVSMASPFQLGPPDSVVATLVDYVERPELE